MPVIYAVNCQAETVSLVPAGMPIVAIIHDDPTDPRFQGLTPFVGMNRKHNRLMSPQSAFYQNLEDGADMVNGNEVDDNWNEWELPYLRDRVRPYGHGLRLHHPAPNTLGQYPYSKEIADQCDVIDMHAGIGLDEASGTVVFFPAPMPYLFGKKVWITEVEVDPDHPELMDHVPDAMLYYANAGHEFIAAWGVAQGVPDVLYHHQDVLDRIAALPQPTPADPKTAAEQAYNLMTGGVPQIPGQQYVAPLGSGFVVVAQFPDESTAEQNYNQITRGGMPFVNGFQPGCRYVQKNDNGTFSVIVSFPL